MPLLELRHRRDPLRRRVRGDGPRRGLQERVPARQPPQVIQLLLDRRRAREPLREGEGGVRDAVYLLAGEPLRLVAAMSAYGKKGRGMTRGRGGAARYGKSGAKFLGKTRALSYTLPQKFCQRKNLWVMTSSLAFYLGFSLRDIGWLAASTACHHSG